jgi:S-DNA-T family DNA segregation ATPase FtsK/SpoIIIE
MGVSTTAKRGDARGTARPPSHLQHEVTGVLLATFGLLTLLSLLSFAPSDVVLFSGGDPLPGLTHNMIGAVGATLARSLFGLIGGAAYLLPVLLAMVAWRCFIEGTLSVTLRSAAGAFVALALLSGLLHLEVTAVPTVSRGWIYHGLAGGVTGRLLAGSLSMYFASTGAHIILLAGLTIALLLATPMSLAEVSRRLTACCQKTREIVVALRPERAAEPERPKKSKAKAVKINRSAAKEETEPSPAPIASAPSVEAPAPAVPPAAPEEEPEFTISRPVASGYKLPDPRELLADLPVSTERMTDEALKAQSDVLTRALQSFGIEGKVTEVHPGPVVTMYEFEPAPGVKVARIVNLADDLALALKAISLRIVAPLPGKSVVGIEVPNPYRETVAFKEVLTSETFRRSRSRLTLALGKDIFGAPVTADLKTMPHLLVAGATGAGKSVGLNSMLLSLLFNAKPNEVKLLLIDPKMLELQVYDGVPHLLRPVITDAKSAARGLGWVVQEMDRRYKLLAEAGVRNIDAYNRHVSHAQGVGKKASGRKEMEQAELPMGFLSEEERLSAGESTEPEGAAATGGMPVAAATPPAPLPYIVVMIDELADLMMVAPKDVEDKIARLAQMARASGIHLVLATQRPSVDVLTGLIKANFPARIAYQVSSKTDSRTILDANGAEALLGRGDMLYLASGTGRLMRLHGCFVSDDDVRSVVEWVKRQAAPTYMEELQSLQQEEVADEQAKDEVYEQAKDLVLSTGQASASLIQRRLRVGYPRAARMIEQMQEEGIVSAPARDGRREVLGRKGPVGEDEP